MDCGAKSQSIDPLERCACEGVVQECCRASLARHAAGISQPLGGLIRFLVLVIFDSTPGKREPESELLVHPNHLTTDGGIFEGDLFQVTTLQKPRHTRNGDCLDLLSVHRTLTQKPRELWVIHRPVIPEVLAKSGPEQVIECTL